MSPAQRTISTFVHVVSGTHPFIRIEEVPVADLEASAIAEGEAGTDQYPVSSLAIDHARRSIERRKDGLRAG
jgi:hypothetical protein